MKSNAARTIPTETATTMSNTTVRPKQVSSTTVSLRGATRAMCTKCFTSEMFQATTSSRAEIAAMGRNPINGASATTDTSTVKA